MTINSILREQIKYWQDMELFEKGMAKRHKETAIRHRKHWKNIEKKLGRLDKEYGIRIGIRVHNKR